MTTFSRYGVSVSAGADRDNPRRRFSVWDRQERRVVTRRATASAAMRVAQKMNREAQP